METSIIAAAVAALALAAAGCGGGPKSSALAAPPAEQKDAAAEQACWDYRDAVYAWKLYPAGSRDLVRHDLRVVQDSAEGSDDTTLRITIDMMLLAAADRRAGDLSKYSKELGRMCARYLAEYLR